MRKFSGWRRVFHLSRTLDHDEASCDSTELTSGGGAPAQGAQSRRHKNGTVAASRTTAATSPSSGNWSSGAATAFERPLNSTESTAGGAPIVVGVAQPRSHFNMALPLPTPYLPRPLHKKDVECDTGSTPSSFNEAASPFSSDSPFGADFSGRPSMNSLLLFRRPVAPSGLPEPVKAPSRTAGVDIDAPSPLSSNKQVDTKLRPMSPSFDEYLYRRRPSPVTFPKGKN